MHKQVDIFKKKEYIRWYLNTYKLKKPDTEKVLHLLLQETYLLEKVHFIEDIRNISNAILISTHDSHTISFILRLDNIYYYEVDEFINQLKNFPPDNIYLWLSFNRDFMCSMCKEVLVDSPQTKKIALNQRVIKDLEHEIHKSFFARDVYKKELLLLIDQAIETNDQELFYKYSEEYKKLA